MNKIGFLAPNGKLIECESYEHLDVAREIAEELDPNINFVSSLDYETYLQELGYIVVRARDVYGLSGRIIDDEGHRIHLTKEQIKWLEDNYENFPDDKRESVDDLFYWDGHNHSKRN